MSRKATDWAWSLSVKPASLKLLLLSMADRADEYHRCYPSIARLVRDTGLNTKTVQKGINDLIAMGVICDTGERVGPTRRVRVLQLLITQNNPENGVIRNTRNAPKSGEFNDTKKGNIPKTGNIPKNGTLNDPKNGTLNDPNIGVQNRSSEPVSEPVINNTKKKSVFDRPEIQPYQSRSAVIEGWHPEEDAISRIQQLNIPRNFILQLIPGFKNYWIEASREGKKPKVGLNTQFLNHCKYEWVRNQSNQNQRGNGHAGSQLSSREAELKKANESTDWADGIGASFPGADSGGHSDDQLALGSGHSDISEVAGVIPSSGRH